MCLLAEDSRSGPRMRIGKQGRALSLKQRKRIPIGKPSLGPKGALE